MRRSNPALPRISLFEFQAGVIGRLRIPFEIGRPLLAVQRGRCDGKPRDAAVQFYGHQTVVGPAKCPGKNQDAMIETGFQAVMHATLGCTMSVGRFWCLPTS
jgi:hypothetical protein